MKHIRVFTGALNSLKDSTCIIVHEKYLTTRVVGRNGTHPESAWDDTVSLAPDQGDVLIDNGEYWMLFSVRTPIARKRKDGQCVKLESEPIPAAFILPLIERLRQYGVPCATTAACHAAGMFMAPGCKFAGVVDWDSHRRRGVPNGVLVDEMSDPIESMCLDSLPPELAAEAERLWKEAM